MECEWRVCVSSTDALVLFVFLWPPYAPAQVNGGSRNFYTWWTLSVNREVTTWIFHGPPYILQDGPKSDEIWHILDPARILSALTPERGRIL